MAHTKENELSKLSWEHSIVQARIDSEKRAWLIARIGTLITLIAVTALAVSIPFKQTITRVVVVDKVTGETSVAVDLPEYVATRNDINDKHWIKRFVIAHERYDYKILQADYDLVRRLAGDVTWAKYKKKFVGENSLQKTLEEKVERIPTILSVTLPSPNIATVRYELEEKDLRNASSITTQPKVTRYIATLEYKYIPNVKVPEPDAIENPLGFTVTGYQVDPEIVVTTDTPTPDANTSNTTSAQPTIQLPTVVKP